MPPSLSWALAVLALLSTAVSLGFACTPLANSHVSATLEYKMMDSDVVAYGIPLRSEEDPQFPGRDIKVVDFEVRCIFKGAPLREVIRIHRVGDLPEMCLSSNLTVGDRFLVYLRKESSGQYVPEYSQDPGDPQYLDEVTVLCEATVSYPQGFSPDNNKESCPEEYTYDDCVPKPVPTTPPTPPTDPPTMKPPVPDSIDVKEPPAPASGSDNEPGYRPVSSDDGGDENVAVTFTLSLSLLLGLLLFAHVL